MKEEVSTHSETLSWAVSEGVLEPQRESALKAKLRFHHRDHCQTMLPSREAAHMPMLAVSRGWVFRLRLQGSDFRESTRVEFHEDTLRELV